jgi:hypothetical protein
MAKAMAPIHQTIGLTILSLWNFTWAVATITHIRKTAYIKNISSQCIGAEFEDSKQRDPVLPIYKPARCLSSYAGAQQHGYCIILYISNGFHSRVVYLG